VTILQICLETPAQNMCRGLQAGIIAGLQIGMPYKLGNDINSLWPSHGRLFMLNDHAYETIYRTTYLEVKGRSA
jgi:hypothetical protein